MRSRLLATNCALRTRSKTFRILLGANGGAPGY